MADVRQMGLRFSQSCESPLLDNSGSKGTVVFPPNPTVSAAESHVPFPEMGSSAQVTGMGAKQTCPRIVILNAREWSLSRVEYARGRQRSNGVRQFTCARRDPCSRLVRPVVAREQRVHNGRGEVDPEGLDRNPLWGVRTRSALWQPWGPRYGSWTGRYLPGTGRTVRPMGACCPT
jgi:hypothetical protein